MSIDQKQQHLINIALVGVGIIGMVVSVLVYLENKKHSKIKGDIIMLDKQIKELDLQLKQDELKRKGV